VIALRFWWDMSIKETAQALGKNENAIKALQHRAVRSLTRMLAEGDDDGA
jgi:RNA polymerase sigma-70 factor (ECF subfamily)